MDVVTLALAKKHTNEQVIQKATNSPTETISFDNGIYSVGNNVVNGQVSDIVLKGRSLKNELNYNRDTWAEWTKPTGVTVVNGELIITLNGSSFIAPSLAGNFKPSTKYGILAYVITPTSTSLQISNNLTGSYVALLGMGLTGNAKQVITTQSSITTNSFEITNNNAGTSGEQIKIKDIRIFELPAGSEIEKDFDTTVQGATNLTADQLAQKYPYINGDSVKSTNSVRLRSVNEDETKESIAYVNLPQGEELRSLPNGVKDEVSVGSYGNWYKTIRIAEVTLLSTKADLIADTSGGTAQYIRLINVVTNNDSWDDSKANTAISGRTKLTSVPTSTQTTNTYRSVMSGATPTIFLYFPIGTFATLQDAKNWLDTNTLTLTYQLATPIVTDIPKQKLEVFENGTVYVEPIGDASESTLPSVEMTIPIGTSNKFGVASHDYDGAAADWTLTNSESKCFMLAVSNAGGAANIIAPDAPGTLYVVINTSGQAVTVKKSGGTGVAVANATNAMVCFTGTDYEKLF